MKEVKEREDESLEKSPEVGPKPPLSKSVTPSRDQPNVRLVPWHNINMTLHLVIVREDDGFVLLPCLTALSFEVLETRCEFLF